MDQPIGFKTAAVALTFYFMWFGMDVRRKRGARNFVAPAFGLAMNAVSFALVTVFGWRVIVAAGANAADWACLLPMAAGTASVAAAKRELGAAHTFIGQFLARPGLVTTGVYSLTRNPLYFGVLLCELGAALFLLRHLPGQGFEQWLWAAGPGS
jgi:protein-S-isoprenylcysteine O-methyltransferase Ste14